MAETFDIEPALVETLHGVEDDAKYKALIEAMDSNGWQGAPIVVVERDNAIPLAFTGSHRLAAAEFVGIEAPAVHLRDVFTDAGLDYDGAVGEFLDAGFDLYDAVVRACHELPTDIIEQYGLDAH